MVLRCQVTGEQADGRQRDGSVDQQIEDHGKLARRTCGLDAAVRRVLRQVQRPRAVHEQRRVPLREVQPTRVHFGEQGDQPGGGVPFPLNGAFEIVNQLFVSQTLNSTSHLDPVVASQFLRREDDGGGDFHRVQARLRRFRRDDTPSTFLRAGCTS
jgi:hypothetical protein